MEYLWSMYGASTLLLPANLQINLEEKENKSTKNAMIPKNNTIIKFLVEKFVCFVKNLYFCKCTFVIQSKR